MEQQAKQVPTTPRRRRPRLRALTSFVVTLSFVGMTVSGAVLYAAPRGRTANWSGWTSVGLWREQWVAVHVVLSTLFVLFGGVHLLLNWRPLWSYVHSRARRGLNLWGELLAAVVLVVGLTTAAIVGLPPARPLVEGSEGMKDSWARALPRAPFPHAELLTVEELHQRGGPATKDLVQALQDAGLRVVKESDSLLQLAEANRSTPAAIFDLLRKRFPELEGIRGGGRTQRNRQRQRGPARAP